MSTKQYYEKKGWYMLCVFPGYTVVAVLLLFNSRRESLYSMPCVPLLFI